MGNNQDVEVKKYDKGKKKIRRGKRKRTSEAGEENGASHCK